MSKHYDYIIAGAGCAGLSLLYRILQEPALANKEILVLDSSNKDKNDRTWCFWEKEAGPFESIVSHKWQRLKFISDDLNLSFSLIAYTYKMIRGIDFYKFIMSLAKKHKNVHFEIATINEIGSDNNVATVVSTKGTFTSSYVFNSTPLFNPKMSISDTLLQHFEGWIVKTKEDYFEPKVATLMDFSVSQAYGTTFMYVLPLAKDEALIEYTLFSSEKLENKKYKQALKSYLANNLGIGDYEIIHSETGSIPMSLKKFKRSVDNNGRIINIGTAGGDTKSSTGYTFNFIQKHTSEIINRLKTDRIPIIEKSFRRKMFDWYDCTLLDVLLNNKMSGKAIFTTMFKKIPPNKILEFLNNESNFLDEIKIMNSLPIMKFASSGIGQFK